MAKINFDPKDTDQLKSFISTLESVDSLLEYSPLIYASNDDTYRTTIENVIRFGNLTPEELNTEREKVTSIMNASILENVAVPVSQQQFLIKMDKLLTSRLNRLDSSTYGENLLILESYNERLYDYDSDYNTYTTECVNIGQLEYLQESFSVNFEMNKINPTSILDTCRNVISSSICNESKDSELIKNFKAVLTERVTDTLKYEMCHEAYHDLPILDTLGRCKEVLLEEYSDSDGAKDIVDDIFDSMEDEFEDLVSGYFKKVKNALEKCCKDPDNEFDLDDEDKDDEDEDIDDDEDEEESEDDDDDTDDDDDDDEEDEDDEEYDKDNIIQEFNPNPFASIYSMTPFPVASRTVAKSIEACLNAKDDKALVESLNHFGRLMTICETYGEDILTESPSGAISKAQRALARGGARVASGAKTVQKAAHAAKDTAKRITDPMARLVEDTYDKIAKADIDERKKIVMTTGFKGKLMKILKRIKDYVLLGGAVAGTAMIGWNVGTVIAGIGLVGYFLTNATLDINARSQVIRELEEELKITQEKIEDSKGDDDKQKKYELMRIESKLQKELARVKQHRNF